MSFSISRLQKKAITFWLLPSGYYLLAFGFWLLAGVFETINWKPDMPLNHTAEWASDAKT
jgi:hypothetical protein